MTPTKIRNSLVNQYMLLRSRKKVLIGKLEKLGPVNASFNIAGYKRKKHLRSNAPLAERFQKVEMWVPTEMVEELGLQGQVIEGAWQEYEESLFSPKLDMAILEEGNTSE